MNKGKRAVLPGWHDLHVDTDLGRNGVLIIHITSGDNVLRQPDCFQHLGRSAAKIYPA